MRRWMLAIGVNPLISCAWLAAGAVVLGAAAPACLAQSDIKAVEPYVAVVTTDKVPMQCSNGAKPFYAVRELKSGELLRVNGEGPGWVRVEYTTGMRAYVPASDADVDRDGKTVKLNKPSRLLAVNPEGKSHWWPLELDADLPPGTVLTVAEAVKRPDGGTEGYYVQAPPKARGFVRTEHVRRANPEEAARYAGATQPAKPAESAAAPGAVPAAAPATGSSSTAAPDAKPAVAPAPTAGNPAAPGTPPGFNPVTPVTTSPSPAATPTAETQPESTAATTTPAPVPPPPPPPAPKKDEEIEQLRTMFDKVMSTGGDAEVPTVIGAFERKIAKLGSGTKDQLIKSSLSQRLDALKLRQEILAQRELARQATLQQTQTVQRVSLIVAEAQRQAIYNIVGRIQPSTVYDGRRGLPLMYRVESADALSPRTVGYIIPTEGMDLLTKIGKVCGVVGESRLDSSLQLNIIAPRRIDVLDVGGTATSPPGVFPEPPATPGSGSPTSPTPDRPATAQQPPSMPEPEK